MCFVLTFSFRPVELHVAGRQKKHRGSAGGLPCGSHPADLQIPAAAEGECCTFQLCIVEDTFCFTLATTLPLAPYAPTPSLLVVCALLPQQHHRNNAGAATASTVQLRTQAGLFQTSSYSWNLKLKSRRNSMCAEELIFLVDLISAFLSLSSLPARLTPSSHQHGNWRCNNNKGVTWCSAIWSLPAARVVPSAITHIL